MKKLFKKDHKVIINSINYYDVNSNDNSSDTFEIEASLELSNYKMLISNDLNHMKFNVSAFVIARNVVVNHTIFTLNASISVISTLKKGVTEEKIKATTIKDNKLDIMKIDILLRPIIGQEINKFLDLTYYQKNNIFSDSNKLATSK